MNIVPDAEYNSKYPERPKRFIIADEGQGPTYVTEDALPATIAQAQAKLDRWKDIDVAIKAIS